jgi:hypothetical protein
VLKNVGTSPAQDVRVEFDPPLVGKVNVSAVERELPNFLTEVVPFLPPQASLRSLMWSALAIFNETNPIPLKYRATVTYKDQIYDRCLITTCYLDLSIYRMSSDVSHYTLSDFYPIIKSVRD